MLEKIKEMLVEPLKKENIDIVDVLYEDEEGVKNLYIISMPSLNSPYFTDLKAISLFNSHGLQYAVAMLVGKISSEI